MNNLGSDEEDKIEVAVIEDHPLFMNGILETLSKANDIKTVWSAANGAEARRNLSDKLPEVLILDLNLPDADGFDIAEDLLRKTEDTQIMVLSSYDDKKKVDRCLSLRIQGYLLKESTPAEILDGVRRVHQGKSYFSQGVVDQLMKIQREWEDVQKRILEVTLTNREKEVLSWLAKGLSTSDVADELNLSSHTVDTHRKNLLSKTGSQNIAGLIVWGFRKGYLK